MSQLSSLVLSHGENTEGTMYPIWFIAVKRGIMPCAAVMVSNGFWFSREAAEEHLKYKKHRYPKSAFVWCGSGHDSAHIRELYNIARTEK